MSRLTDSVGAVARAALTTRADQTIPARLCGCGDKDIFTVAEAQGAAR